MLTLIRHGHTAWNGMGRYQGHAPIPLSERGHAQVRHLAGALAQERGVTAIYSSDLLRCRQTAEPIARALGLGAVYDPRLREMDYGTWQGLTRQEVAALDAAHYAAYQADAFNVSVPGGESQRMLAGRVLAALADVLAMCRDGHAVIVTHGGPIREMLRRFGLWSGGVPVGNASRTVVRLADGDGGQAVLCVYGDTSYLPPELRPDAAGTQFLTQE